MMEIFPLVKRSDEQRYSEYLMKQMILEVYDAMQRALEIGDRYKTRLGPPTDLTVAHGSRVMQV